VTTPTRSLPRRSSRRGGATRLAALTALLALLGAAALAIAPAAHAASSTTEIGATALVSGTSTALSGVSTSLSNTSLSNASLSRSTEPTAEPERTTDPLNRQTAPSPTPSNEQGAVRPQVTITSPGENSFISGTSVSFSGTKSAGTSITIPSVTGGDPLCVVAADSSTRWSCGSVTLPSGTVGIVAREYEDSTVIGESSPLTLRVLGSPAISGSGTIISSGALDGVGWDGASMRVIISSPTSSTQVCSQPVSNGYWYCGLALSSGDYRVQVQQSWPGSSNEWSPASAPRNLTVDVDIPVAPVVTLPRANQQVTAQPTTYEGTGENLATVDVFVDDQFACTARVEGTTWRCSGSGVADGQRSVTAIQRDAAQNVSPPSSIVRVTYAAPVLTPSPSATPTDPTTPADPNSITPTVPASPSAAPVLPVPETTPPEATAPVPTPSETPQAAPFFSPPPGGKSGLPPGETWGTPTQYGAAIATPVQTLTNGNWMLGAVLALGWLLLIALPLRLLATTLRGRVGAKGPRFTGRNRLSSERRLVEEHLPALNANPIFIAGGALLGAAVLAVLASGIQGEVRYLRLTIAVAVGLSILNIAAVVSTRFAGRAFGVASGIRLVPIFLAVGAATALLSRIGGIQPPLIVGVVVGLTFAAGVPAKSRGSVQLVQIGVLTVLAVAAWLVLGSLGTADGFWPSAIHELLSAVCLAGLGSALLLLLPVLSLPGRAILEWSPAIWLGTTIVVALLAGVVLTGENFPVLLMAGGALAIAIVSVGTWGWSRFSQPITH
jgi:hypothetical protein